MQEPKRIETRLATMSLVEPWLVEQRFREGIKLDRAGFEENRKARHALGAAAPYAMLSILPEDLDFDMDVINTDHFALEQEVVGLSALAVVAHGQMSMSIAGVFFKYFPPKFPVSLFNNEKDARAWLVSLRA